jgi:hypothetical protein
MAPDESKASARMENLRRQVAEFREKNPETTGVQMAEALYMSRAEVEALAPDLPWE